MKNYAVLGLGLFGSQTAIELAKCGKTVFAIDNNEEKVEAIADSVYKAVTADSTDRDVLLQLGIDKCECAVVAMSRDLSASVLTIVNLRAIGVKQIVCKAQNERDKEVFETLGATSVIIPEIVAGEKLCKKLVYNNVIDYIEFSDGYSIVEMVTPKEWHGKNLREINARAKYGITIIAIKNGKDTVVSPGADHVVGKESTIMIVGDEKAINKVQKL